jgi:hypothetical protein
MRLKPKPQKQTLEKTVAGFSPRTMQHVAASLSMSSMRSIILELTLTSDEDAADEDAAAAAQMPAQIPALRCA